jgi:hypothetical protein
VSQEFTAGKIIAARIDRRCDRCGHQYVVRRQVRAWIAVPATTPWGAEERVQRRLNLRVENLKNGPASRTVGVLCPKCGRFSAAALNTHFPEGLREGLMDKLVAGSATSLKITGGIMAGLGLLLVLGMLVAFRAGDLLNSILRLLAVLVVLAVGGGVTYGWARLQDASLRRHGLAALDGLSDAYLLLLIKIEYQLSGDSLGLEHTFVDHPGKLQDTGVGLFRLLLERHGDPNVFAYASTWKGWSVRSELPIRQPGRFVHIVEGFKRTLQSKRQTPAPSTKPSKVNT